MRTGTVAALLFAAAVAVGQDPVTVTMSGGGQQIGSSRAYKFNGEVSISGLEVAVLSGSGTISDEVIMGGQTILTSGTFTLIFPSGGTMVGNYTVPAGILIPTSGTFGTANVTFTVTGGTGRYEGARGHFPAMSGSGSATGNGTGVFQISGAGTLSIGARTLSQLAFGGGWYSAVYLANAGTAQVTFPVNFVTDNGAPLNVPALGGSSTSVTIPPGGSVRLEAPNSGPLVQGYVAATLPAGVTGYGVFRQSVNGIADQEAVVPLSNAAGRFASLVFDDTNYITAVAVVNPSLNPVVVTITAKGASGSVLGTATLPLAPKNKTAVVLRNVQGLAGVAGNRGVVSFSVDTGSVSVLGLRFFGSAFTSIPALEQ